MEILKVVDLAVYFGEEVKTAPKESFLSRLMRRICRLEPRERKSTLVRAVDHISFSLESGDILGIVGESGSGKTKTAETIMRILPRTARIISGQIFFKGEELLSLPEKKMRKIRGKEIVYIPQDPAGSLNPVYSVGDQIKEMFKYHRQDVPAKQRKREVIKLLEQVRIPDAQKRYSSFPHELSGGMNQRAIIAMALAVNPNLIIADEPTTALDVTVQAKILDELTQVIKAKGISLIFITHNLGLVAEYADKVLVMQKGKIVDQGPVLQFFSQPKHPYTQHLLDVVPKLGGGSHAA